QWMVPDRLAIIPDLATRALGNLALQLQFPRNHRLREIAFADEIRNDVNVLDRVWIKKKDRVAQARLFFPECALHVGKNISPPDLGRMSQRRRAPIRLHRRAMPDNSKYTILSCRLKLQNKSKVSTTNVY